MDRERERTDIDIDMAELNVNERGRLLVLSDKRMTDEPEDEQDDTYSYYNKNSAGSSRRPAFGFLSSLRTLDARRTKLPRPVALLLTITLLLLLLYLVRSRDSALKEEPQKGWGIGWNTDGDDEETQGPAGGFVDNETDPGRRPEPEPEPEVGVGPTLDDPEEESEDVAATTPTPTSTNANEATTITTSLVLVLATTLTSPAPSPSQPTPNPTPSYPFQTNCSNEPQRRQYLFFPSHEEQLSNARLHFAEWLYMAQLTKRTLVLPRVGESRIMMEGKFRFGAYMDSEKAGEFAGRWVDYDELGNELAARGWWEEHCSPAKQHRPFTVTGLVQDLPRSCLYDDQPTPAPNDKPHFLHEGKMFLRKLNSSTGDLSNTSSLDWGTPAKPVKLLKDGRNIHLIDTLRRVVFWLRRHPFANLFQLDTSPADAQPSDRTRCLIPRDNNLTTSGEQQKGDTLSVLRQIQPSDLDADIWLVTKTHAGGDWRLFSWDRMQKAEEALEYSPFVVELVENARKRSGMGGGYLGVHWRMEEARFQRFDFDARGGKEEEPEMCAEMLFEDLKRAAQKAGLDEDWTVYVSTDHTDPQTLRLLGLAKSSSQPAPESLGKQGKVKVERMKMEAGRRARAWKRLRGLLRGRMKTFFEVFEAEEITGPLPGQLLVNSSSSTTGNSNSTGVGIARDPGLLGIADKLFLRASKVFLWGQPPCGRHFTHYAFEVEEWRKREGLGTGVDEKWGNATKFEEVHPGWKVEKGLERRREEGESALRYMD